MMGVSYPGWLTVVAMLDPHPALKAVSPQASPADMFIGDDFHHNGAFRLSYGFEYAVMMETNKERAAFAFNDSDTYDWYLKLGSLAHVNEKYLHGNIPSWNDFANHPSYDSFWQKQAVAPYVDRVNVPTLSVAGWWDQEDFYGPIKIYELLEKYDTKNLNYPRRRPVESRRLERCRAADSSATSTSDRRRRPSIAAACSRRSSRIG